ncbi:PAS domain S-box protein [Leptospira ilyithenensis]|uniref:Sensor protein FixL n=1 Tax=Leptospira ilyithenensis TaxID=2484901 RepID=A0A4V3JWP6_9LEPT|nr:PAS domain S-box protein [Leptospira ilyithenensis]TGN06899.1 PAS domain S-box protein [Leptospira ilyithenensis]
MNYTNVFPEWMTNSEVYYYLLTNLSGEYLYTNDWFKFRFAKTHAALLYQSALHFIHPGDRSAYLTALEECIASSKPIHLQFRKHSNDPEINEWTEWEFSAWKNEEGMYAGVLQIGHDVVEAAKSNDPNLKIVTENLFRSTFEHAAAGIAHFYPDGKWLRYNQQFQELLGYSKEELENLTSDDLTHPKDRNTNNSSFSELIKGTIDKYSIEKRLLTKGGTYVWVIEHISAIYDGNGNIDYIVKVVQDLSAIKNAEQQFIESEEKFKKTFYSNPAFMILSEQKSGTIVEANLAWTEIFGYSLEETVGRNSIELGILELESRAQLVEILEKEKRIKNFEINIKNKNGVIKTLLSSAEIFPYKGETYVLITGIDVSERRKLEEDLIIEKQRLSDILEGTNVGIWEWNISTGEVFLDERWANMLGYRLSELGNTNLDTLAKFTLEEDLSRIGEIMKQHLRGETPYYEAEFRMKHRFGHTIWVLDRAKVTKWSNDKEPLFMHGTRQDISERKRHEASLIKNEIRLKTILATIIDALLIIDQNGIIQKCNLATEKTFGYTESELIGQNVKILMPEPDHSQHDQYLQKYHTTGIKKIIGYGRQIIGRRKNGDNFPAELSVTEWEFSGEKYFTGTIRDISNKIKVEEQLKQSQKLEALGQIAGGIAHDFNNILAIVSGNLELIQRKIIDSGQQFTKQIGSALKAVDRGSQLTQKLLAFARKQPVVPTSVEINQVIANMQEILERVIGKHIQIQFKFYDKPLYLFLDKNDMENSILNLAINARDAMENAGSLIITIDRVQKNILPELQNSPNLQENYAEISVIDTGKGIPPHILEKIYEPFFTTKAVGQGTGLGLSMIYTFVKHFKGHIKVYSEVNIGTSFKLYFPLMEENSETENPIAEQNTNQSSNDKYSERVLLVDDEEGIIDIAETLLVDLGFTVTTAVSADDALKLLDNKGSFDLLISDIMMPGEIDGLALAEIVKKDYPNMKIILTSGFPGDLRKREYSDLKEFHFLSKPYKAKELEETIQKALGRKHEF